MGSKVKQTNKNHDLSLTKKMGLFSLAVTFQQSTFEHRDCEQCEE